MTRANYLQVLHGEDLRRGKHARLRPLPGGVEHRQERHRRLPGPHVALQQPEHPEAAAASAAVHVPEDLAEGLRQRERGNQKNEQTCVVQRHGQGEGQEHTQRDAVLGG